jgi:hypothetical protein
VLVALNELIEAIDGRVRHLERFGEERIAREAAALRKEAVTRIEQVRAAASGRQRETELAHAVMTDDGAPRRGN